MSSPLRKFKKQKENLSQQIDVRREVQQKVNDSFDLMYKTLMAAFLLSMNTVAGIGPKRGTKIIECTNEYIEKINNGDMSREDLIEMAELIFKINLGINRKKRGE